MYTLHMPKRKKFTRNKVIVSGIDNTWQADLVDLNRLSRKNNGFKYVITCIDVFSKFAWVIPIKTKTAKDTVEGFKKILK